jgi:hypothetical protein
MHFDFISVNPASELEPNKADGEHRNLAHRKMNG